MGGPWSRHHGREDSLEGTHDKLIIRMDEAAHRVCKVLLGGSPASHLYELDHCSLGPVVRLKHPATMAAGLAALGECGDPKCSLQRLERPQRRTAFRELVAASTVALLAMRSSCVHYVSVGTGLALFDFEVLLALQKSGLQIGSIVLHDLLYDGQSNAHEEALRAFKRFFFPVDVHTFASLGALHAACADAPGTIGNATVFVQCDADEVGETHALEVAAACLREGGLAFRLTAAGTTRCWRRVRTPTASGISANVILHTFDAGSSEPNPPPPPLVLLSSELNPWLEYSLD